MEIGNNLAVKLINSTNIMFWSRYDYLMNLNTRVILHEKLGVVYVLLQKNEYKGKILNNLPQKALKTRKKW